jgi:hypothetical protein
MDMLKYNTRTANQFYTLLIEALELVTGKQWGLVMGRRIVHYASSHDIPIKVGRVDPKVPGPCALDLIIIHSVKPPEGSVLWKRQITAELIVAFRCLDVNIQPGTAQHADTTTMLLLHEHNISVTNQ